MTTERLSKYPPVRSVRILAKCPQCQVINKLVVDWNNIRRQSKCQGCGELVPTGAFRVIALSNEPEKPIF